MVEKDKFPRGINANNLGDLFRLGPALHCTKIPWSFETCDGPVAFSATRRQKVSLVLLPRDNVAFSSDIGNIEDQDSVSLAGLMYV